MKLSIKYYFVAIFFIIELPACKKAIEIEPPINSIIGKEIYKTDIGAASVLTSIYADMMNDQFIVGLLSIDVVTGLYGDELSLDPSRTDDLNTIYQNSLTTQDPGFWSAFYGYIFRVNSAIEGISNSKTLTPTIKSHLIGEAKFMRAFFYFYLVNFYGDLPLPTSTDLKVNATLSRSSKQAVYDQIITDLFDAKKLLSSNYLGADIKSLSNFPLRPNKSVADALLARVYLFHGDWALAESTSSLLIDGNGNYSLENDLDNVFLVGSKETIWALQPTSSFGRGKTTAGVYILTSGTSYSNPVFLSDFFYSSFDNSDKRKLQWIGTYTNGSITERYPLKYKDVTDGSAINENFTVFRLAEQYLIRAEARAELGKITGSNSAEEDLNIIRQRAGLSPTTASTLSDMRNAILEERKFEFFTEWGHRWLDIKRAGTVDQIMALVGPLKGANWQAYKSLFPIPVMDIQKDPNLKGHQNPGYPEK